MCISCRSCQIQVSMSTSLPYIIIACITDQTQITTLGNVKVNYMIIYYLFPCLSLYTTKEIIPATFIYPCTFAVVNQGIYHLLLDRRLRYAGQWNRRMWITYKYNIMNRPTSKVTNFIAIDVYIMIVHNDINNARVC